MTREGEELTRERIRRLWERSSSVRFAKEAKGEIHMATTKRFSVGGRKENVKKKDKPIFGERSVR